MVGIFFRSCTHACANIEGWFDDNVLFDENVFLDIVDVSVKVSTRLCYVIVVVFVMIVALVNGCILSSTQYCSNFERITRKLKN